MNITIFKKIKIFRSVIISNIINVMNNFGFFKKPINNSNGQFPAARPIPYTVPSRKFAL